MRESHEFFPTQPVPYISPYSTQSEYLQGGKKKKIMSSKIGRGKKNDLAYSPFFSKLSESKHISNDLEITESVLNMPEVRMLMVRILERKKEGWFLFAWGISYLNKNNQKVIFIKLSIIQTFITHSSLESPGPNLYYLYNLDDSSIQLLSKNPNKSVDIFSVLYTLYLSCTNISDY